MGIILRVTRWCNLDVTIGLQITRATKKDGLTGLNHGLVDLDHDGLTGLETVGLVGLEYDSLFGLKSDGLLGLEDRHGHVAVLNS